MNEYLVTALAILISIGIGFFLLIVFGVSWVGYFAITVILLSIIGSYAYAWWKTQSDKTVEKLKTEILINMKKELQEIKKVLSQAEGLADMKPYKHDLDRLVHNLIELNLYDEGFKLTDGIEKYTLTFVEQESRRTEQKVRPLGALAAGSYRPKLDGYAEDIRSKLGRLFSSGYAIDADIKDFNAIVSTPSKSLKEMIGKKERVDDAMMKILGRCVEEVRGLAATGKEFGGTGRIDKKLEKVDKSDFEATVSQLVTAREGIKGILNDAFTGQHSRLLQNVKKVQDNLKSENVSEERKRAIDEMRSTLESMTDPGKFLELKDLEVHFKKFVNEAINEINTRLQEMEERIKQHEPDERIWTLNEKIPSLIKRVDISKTIDDFSKDAINALKAVVEQLDRDKMFMKLMENYMKVEPLIARKLKETGKVTGEDLKVKYVEKFLLLYNLKNPKTKFKESPLKLTKK